MNDNARKFRQARDQLYNLKVYLAGFQREKMPKHPTPELEQVVSMVMAVVDASCECFMEGAILEVLINRYDPLALPGFENEVAEMKDAMRRSGVNSWFEGDEDS